MPSTTKTMTQHGKPVSQEQGLQFRRLGEATRRELPSDRRIDPNKVDMEAISRNLGCYVSGD